MELSEILSIELLYDESCSSELWCSESYSSELLCSEMSELRGCGMRPSEEDGRSEAGCADGCLLGLY